MSVAVCDWRSIIPRFGRGTTIPGRPNTRTALPSRPTWASGEAAFVLYSAMTGLFVSRTRHDGPRAAFCATCGTPLLFERSHSPQMVNVPRALFEQRTGREPRYHIALEETPEWAYRGEPLGPLKGFPGVAWARPRKHKGSNSRVNPSSAAVPLRTSSTIPP